MQLLEDIFVNSEWELVTSDSTGDLIADTCPILLFQPTRDHDGTLVEHGRKFVLLDYAVRDEIVDLLAGKPVFFSEVN